MFMLKKLIKPFLLPPGTFIVLLMLFGVWFLFRRNWKTAISNLLLGFSMWLLSVSPVTDPMFKGLESGLEIPKNPQGDVIILLGHSVYVGGPDLSGVGSPSGCMLERMVTAIRLQKKLRIPIIISGDMDPQHEGAGTLIVKRFLVDLGLPPTDIILEAKSRDTVENAKYARDICEKFDFTRPILVTSASHMKRSLMCFRKVGMDVIPFPAGFRSWEGKEYGFWAYLPGSYRELSIALNEYIGLALYKVLWKPPASEVTPNLPLRRKLSHGNLDSVKLFL